MDTAVYLQIALLAYFCLIICHMARYDKKEKSTQKHTFITRNVKQKKNKKKQHNTINFNLNWTKWNETHTYTLKKKNNSKEKKTHFNLYIERLGAKGNPV